MVEEGQNAGFLPPKHRRLTAQERFSPFPWDSKPPSPLRPPALDSLAHFFEQTASVFAKLSHCQRRKPTRLANEPRCVGDKRSPFIESRQRCLGQGSGRRGEAECRMGEGWLVCVCGGRGRGRGRVYIGEGGLGAIQPGNAEGRRRELQGGKGAVVKRPSCPASPPEGRTPYPSLSPAPPTAAFAHFRPLHTFAPAPCTLLESPHSPSLVPSIPGSSLGQLCRKRIEVHSGSGIVFICYAGLLFMLEL